MVVKNVGSSSQGTERSRVQSEAGWLEMVAKKVSTMVMYGLNVNLESGVGFHVGFLRT